jgi:hypothetical protein
VWSDKAISKCFLIYGIFLIQALTAKPCFMLEVVSAKTMQIVVSTQSWHSWHWSMDSQMVETPVGDTCKKGHEVLKVHCV